MNTKITLNSCKLFLKTISCVIPYTLLLVIINRMLVTNCENYLLDEPLRYFSLIRSVCFVLFAFYIFISYEFMRKAKDASLDEALETCGLRGKLIHVSQLLILMMCVLISSINIAVYSVIGYMHFDVPKGFVKDIVLMNVLDILLLSLTGVFIGLLISKLKNRFVGYTMLSMVLLCVSPAMDEILRSLDFYDIPLYKLRDLLNLLPPDINSMTEKLYGFPIEGYRFAIMISWILLVSVIFAFSWLKNRKRLQQAVCIALSLGLIFSLSAYIDKGSILLTSYHPESSIDSVTYYRKNEPKQAAADFEVGVYDMDLKIDKKLNATVKMEIAQQPSGETDSDSYKFTLYHNYKIKKVYDETKKSLEFKQDGDYFDVIKPDGKDVNSIIVEYSGYSEAFYSNSNAVFLPGFFAYYPQAGHNIIYSASEYNYVPTAQKPSKFNVNIQSNLELTSNLKTAGNRIEGEAENLTLIGGLFEERVVNGHDVIIYPLHGALSDSMTQIVSPEYQARLDKAKALLGETSDISFLGKKIISIPYSLSFNTLLRDVYIYEDSIIMHTSNVLFNEYSVFNAYIPDSIGKEDLKMRFLDAVLMAVEGMEVALLSERGIVTRAAQVSDMLTSKIMELGIDYVAPIVYEYLKDESNTTDELEFLKSIK